MAGRLMLVWAVIGLAFLAGCAGGAEPTGSAAVLSEGYDGAPPVQTQLIVGTLQLEESEAAVTAEQAAELIPLWKAVRSLSGSDTAAEAEIQAVLQQIQETMSAEQLEAIAAMQLTQEDLFGVIQELGIGPGGAATGEGEFQFSGGQPSAGGPPEGFIIQGGPGEAGGQVFSQDLDPDQLATLEARRASGGGIQTRGGQFLIDPLLEMLEARAAGS